MLSKSRPHHTDSTRQTRTSSHICAQEPCHSDPRRHKQPRSYTSYRSYQSGISLPRKDLNHEMEIWSVRCVRDGCDGKTLSRSRKSHKSGIYLPRKIQIMKWGSIRSVRSVHDGYDGKHNVDRANYVRRGSFYPEKTRSQNGDLNLSGLCTMAAIAT